MAFRQILFVLSIAFLLAAVTNSRPAPRKARSFDLSDSELADQVYDYDNAREKDDDELNENDDDETGHEAENNELDDRSEDYDEIERDAEMFVPADSDDFDDSDESEKDENDASLSALWGGTGNPGHHKGWGNHGKRRR